MPGPQEKSCQSLSLAMCSHVHKGPPCFPSVVSWGRTAVMTAMISLPTSEQCSQKALWAPIGPSSTLGSLNAVSITAKPVGGAVRVDACPLCRWEHARQCLHIQLQEGSLPRLHSAQLTWLHLRKENAHHSAWNIRRYQSVHFISFHYRCH